MPIARRTHTLPMPGAELARLRDTLDTAYGHVLWGEGSRILVIRVPGDEPDIVNDLESAIEVLDPVDLDANTAILVGNQRTHLLPTQVMRDLMAQRIRFDRAQCARLRNLAPLAPHIFTSPEDPRRQKRLAIRVALPRVAALDDDGIAALTRVIGPQLPQYAGIRIVYLIADKDEVRVDGGLFLQDVATRWGEETERQRLARELATSLTPRPAKRQVAYEELERIAPVIAPVPARGAAAALWRATPPPDGSGRAARPDGPPDLDAESLHAAVDAAVGDGPREPLRRSLGAYRATDAPAPPAPAPPVAEAEMVVVAPELAALAARLEALGYVVALHPPARLPVDLAGERPAYPTRVVARVLPHLDRAGAEAMLAATKELAAEQGIVLSPTSDVEARRRFIATRVRWLAPADVPGLDL